MAFSQATIVPEPVAIPSGVADLLITWESTSPAGTHFQIYINRRLVYSGTARKALVSRPPARSVIQVGTVLPGEAGLDLSATLPAVAGDGNAPELDWYGGTFLAEDIDGFNVYGATVVGSGSAVDYVTPLSFLRAYPAGIIVDGWGVGGWGQGGWGRSASHYYWRGDPRANGAWRFGVKAVDQAGNEGPAVEFVITLAGPPQPPARNAAGQRLTGVYNSGAGTATLSWLASPG